MLVHTGLLLFIGYSALVFKLAIFDMCMVISTLQFIDGHNNRMLQRLPNILQCHTCASSEQIDMMGREKVVSINVCVSKVTPIINVEYLLGGREKRALAL